MQKIDTLMCTADYYPDDHNWLSDEISHITNIKVNKEDFNNQQEHKNYLKNILSLGKKIVFCMKCSHDYYCPFDEDSKRPVIDTVALYFSQCLILSCSMQKVPQQLY